MTDEETTLKAAREKVATRYPGCAQTIRAGSWDDGGLVRNAIAELIRDRQEVAEE